MNRTRLLGGWSMAGMEFDIVEAGDNLVVAFPEAPEGFEAALEQTDGDEYVIRGGQFDGAQMSFATDESGRPFGMIAGIRMLTPLDRPSSPPPGSGLAAPPLEITEDVERQYRALLGQIEERSDGRNIDDDLPTSPTPFVQWLMAQDVVVFHGSNRRDIAEFRPVRASMELGDTGGRGNLGAVYGTHDGLWSMFFAVIDRQRLRGSIRNGVTRYRSTDRTLDLYHFSIHHELLAEPPLTAGTLYLLPREAFKRLPFFPGGPLSNEWACTEPIRPLAQMTITPDDFPFAIGGHDDGALLRFGELADEIYGRVVSAGRIESGFEIVTTADPSMVDRFIALSAEFYPDVSRTATPSSDGVLISMTGPPAFLDSMGKKLAPHLPDAS